MFMETVCCGTDTPLNENFGQKCCIWHLLDTVCASPVASGLFLPKPLHFHFAAPNA